MPNSPETPKNQKLRVLGKIDLDQYIKNRLQPVDSLSRFKILQMKVSFFGKSAITVNFGDADNKDHRYFSLFIGMNGVGKSTLMREIVDFFIDSQYGKSRKTEGQQVRIISLKYAIEGHIYQIEKDEKNVFSCRRDMKRAKIHCDVMAVMMYLFISMLVRRQIIICLLPKPMLCFKCYQ